MIDTYNTYELKKPQKLRCYKSLAYPKETHRLNRQLRIPIFLSWGNLTAQVSWSVFILTQFFTYFKQNTV